MLRTSRMTLKILKLVSVSTFPLLIFHHCLLFFLVFCMVV
jgi:hypothetical protein